MPEFDMNQIILAVMPYISMIIYLVVGLAIVVGIAYYLFIVRRRRVWIVDLWEQKADGQLHMIGKDKIVEKKINKGKQIIYVFTKRRIEVFPPPDETVQRYLNKEYTNYLRVRDDYIPMEKKFNTNIINMPFAEKQSLFRQVWNKLKIIRGSSTIEVNDQFIHIPIKQALVANFDFVPMEYDVNMMRINAIENREKVYMDQQEWLQKYGHLVAIGVIVVLIIVVLYFSYEYSQSVIQIGMGEARAAITAIEKLAQSMGGNLVPPAS